MKRKIYDKLLDWKNNSQGDCAILIQGARRVGKSYIAEEFGRNEYEAYLLIDFSAAAPEIIDLFRHYRHDISFILERLQLFYNKSLPVRKSLIIFDEIQFCPEARSAIKQLVADKRYDYIETGSLISIKQNVKDILIPSEERSIDMYPLDFEEFLWAKGETNLFPFIRNVFESKTSMGIIHRKALEFFKEYMIVGGMPQAVKAYIDNRDFNEIDSIKNDIINLYRSDIRKYAQGESIKASAIFDEIPGQLQRHEKKFRLAELKKEARMRSYENAFFWLSDAFLINCCYNSTAPNIGLRLNENRTSLKCYMGDTGLLVSMAFSSHERNINEIYKKIISGKLEINEGMLTENVVAQMLKAAGHPLFFYSRKDSKDAQNTLEIDFLVSKSSITSRHNIIPIEVKSGERYTYSSINKIRDKYKTYISTPIILHDKDLYEKDGILFVPLYMAGLI